MEQNSKKAARITHAGITRECDPAVFQAVLDEMIAQTGEAFGPGTRIEVVEVLAETPAPPAPIFTVKEGEVDPRAAERVNAQQDVLRAAGFDVGNHHQAFDSGTRMLDVGHSTMEHRKREHDELRPLSAVLDEIDATISA